MTTLPNERDKTIDVMLSIGIIMVVVGHKYQPPFLYFPAYSFQVALFFFVSGYLAKHRSTVKEKTRQIWKKTKSQLMPYAIYNLIFCIITYFLSVKGIILGSEVCFENFESTKNSLYNFFVVPFVNGHQYALYLAAWFWIQLYVVGVVFQIISISNNKYVTYSIFATILVSNYFTLKYGLLKQNNIMLFLIRTNFGLLFYYAGFLFKSKIQFIRKIFTDGYFTLIPLLLLNIVAQYGANNQKITYSIVWGSVENDLVFVPVVTTFSILFITFWLSYVIGAHLNKKSMFYYISKHSSYIMIFHLSIFFAINFVFYKLNCLSYKDLSNIWCAYKVSEFWLLYIILGICVPIALGFLIEKMKFKFVAIFLAPKGG